MSDAQLVAAAGGLADRPLGELATALPGATAVFRAHKLDYCCGGRASLREAAAAKAVDLASLTSELESLAGIATPAAAPDDTGSLITFIETRLPSGAPTGTAGADQAGEARRGGPPRQSFRACRTRESARAHPGRTHDSHAEGRVGADVAH